MEQKKKKRVIIITVSVVLGMFLILLMVLDLNIAIQKSIAAYKDNQDLLADVMMENAVSEAQNNDSDLTDIIVSDIKENFPTSSSIYCIFAKNDDIVFLKDDNTTSTLIDEKVSDFFNKNNVSSRDNKKYILSKTEKQFEEENYTLVICTKQEYIVKKINFDEIRLHCLGYFIIYGATLFVIIVFSFYRLRSDEKIIKSLEDEIEKNRVIIERLENDRNKYYVNSENEEHYSFYDRSIVDEVITCMSEEEKEKCIQIDIFVENLKMEHFVLITAILGRIKEGNSVACYWEDNQFKVLLFHSGKDEVQGFTNLFISKYKTESKEKVEELKIVANRLLGGNNEI